MEKWNPLFGPCYSPKEMLELGVFEGKYINGIKGIPTSWKNLPKVLNTSDNPDPELNYFKIKSRQPLSVWKKNGWIRTDKEGWFIFFGIIRNRNGTNRITRPSWVVSR